MKAILVELCLLQVFIKAWGELRDFIYLPYKNEELIFQLVAL